MAQSASKYAEIQQDEIEVLRSIYMEDFVEIKTKTGAWNVGKFSSNMTEASLGLSTSTGL